MATQPTQKTFGARSFRSNGSIAPLSLGVPAAAYPGRIATSSDLIVAVDRQQTTLLLPLTAGAVSMSVLDASMIGAYNLLSIEDEIVKTTGAPSGNVVPISRGFDGTTAAAHLSGAQVLGLVDAFHHNALVAEVEAIETALGPHLSNITTTNWPFVASNTFDFAPQTPGGSLIVGANSITLSPVPAGVNGTDQNHYLYISGGTGTPESALIVGGTAVAGAASGTLIIQCANTHSGAWTIQSSTRGIRESLLGTSAPYIRVRIPPGTFAIDSLVLDKLCWLEGSGENVTVLQSLTGKTPALITVYPNGLDASEAPGHHNYTSIRVSDFTVDLDNGSPAGTSLIGMQVDFVNRGRFDHLRFRGGAYGMKIATTASVAWCHFSDITIVHPSNTGFWVGDQGMENWYDDLDIQQDSTNPMQCGFQINRTTATDIGNNYMKRVRMTRMASGALTNGFLFTSSAANTVFNVEMLDCVADAITGDALKMVNCAEVRGVLCWFASTGSDSTGAAINFNGGYNFSFVQCKISSQNASAFAYSNSPQNLLFLRNTYLAVANFVHNLPATGYPLGLEYAFDAMTTGAFASQFTNSWATMANTQTGGNPMSPQTITAGGNYEFLYIWDGFSGKYARMYFGAGAVGFLNDAHSHLMDINTTSGTVTIAGTLVANLPSANPGPTGGLYIDPATHIVYQGH